MLDICVLDSARKGKRSVFHSRRKAGKRNIDEMAKITDAFMCCTIHRLNSEIRV